MSDTSAQPIAWPAARPTGISPIQHPAWEEARNAILDLAAEGPVTAVIVGEPGTGKTWLLRELASALSDHGFPTMMLMQGNLPMMLSSGAALLVDNASLMDEPTRARMSAQQHGVVVLAAAEWVEDELDPASPSPVIIDLRPLQPGEIADFAAEWLDRAGLSDSMIGPGMLSRLTARSGGRVGTIVESLGESAAAWQTSPIIAPAETWAAAISAEQPIATPVLPTPIVPTPIVHTPIVPTPIVPTPIVPTPILPTQAVPTPVPPTQVLPTPAQPTPPLYDPERPRRNVYRPLLAGAAIAAAAIVLAWALMPPPPAKIALVATPAPAPLPPIAAAVPAVTAPLPPVRKAETSHPPQTAVADVVPPVPPAAAPAPLPPLRHADTRDPALAAASAPTQPIMSTPSLVPTPTPELDASSVPVETEIPTPFPAIAAAPPPLVLTPSDPSLVATLGDPGFAGIPMSPDTSRPNRAGGPGLVLIAQRGDTLESLYGSIYRDRSAPPFATVLAANPGRFKPGAIVVFPEPPGGWQRVQR